MEEQETKSRILAGAETLFMKYGIRSVSMDDIARQLAVSKKPFINILQTKMS